MDRVTEGAGGLSDRVMGKVKKVAGHVIGDPVLEHEGELHEERADAVAETLSREVEAEQAKAEAELAERQRQLDAEQRELTAAEAADRREQQIAAEKAAEERRLATEHQAREAAIESCVESTENAVDADERRAAAQWAEQRKQADALEREADKAKQRAEVFDQVAHRNDPSN